MVVVSLAQKDPLGKTEENREKGDSLSPASARNPCPTCQKKLDQAGVSATVKKTPQ